MNDEYVETSYVSSSSLMNIMIWCLVLFRTIYLMLFFLIFMKLLSLPNMIWNI